MSKVISKFDINNINNAFNGFNRNIFDNYESMLYFLELIIENFNNLKHLEEIINKKLFESLNILININKIDNKEEILKIISNEKFIIYIFYLLLKTKGKYNPKNCRVTFEIIECFLNMIAKDKKIVLKIFYIFFVELFETSSNIEKNELQNINYDYFTKLKIAKLNLNKFDYLSNIIKYFSKLDPEKEIINLFNNYFYEIFYRFFKTVLSIDYSLNNNNNKTEIIEDDFILCNFYHIFSSKKIYYQFYLYLIHYSKVINNKFGIINLFPDLKGILTDIYNLCPNPFYFEILVNLFQNLNEVPENIIYIKEIFDILLNLNYIDLNKEKQKICLFNTLQLLKLFFYISRKQNLFIDFFKLGLSDYILKFFDNLKKLKYIFIHKIIKLNINGNIYQQTILEICLNIIISAFLVVKNNTILKKFFGFFLENNNKDRNRNKEFGKSIIFVFDIFNYSLDININEDTKQLDENYLNELENYLTEKNYERYTKILLIELIMKLQMIKLNELEKKNIIFIHESSIINKFISLFIDDFLILIKYTSNLKKSKNDSIYNDIIDLINKNNAKENIITKEKLITIFEDICHKNKKNLNIFDDKHKSILFDYIEENCFLKEKCLLLIDNNEKKSFDDNQQNKEIIYSYFDIEHINIIKCFKKDLLLKDCSIYFSDIYFYDRNFIKIKNSFYYNYNSNLSEQNLNEYKTNFLKYPSKLKNFSSNKYALPKIFLSCNTKLYLNKHFSLLYPKINKNLIKDEFPFFPSHYIYHLELLKNSPQPPIFQEKLNCELIAIKYVIFGEIIFYENYLIFKSDKNKNNIIKEYENNINYVFNSGIKEIQYLDKIIILLYDDIEEIFNRCFAYIPQAVEIFLKNGKSYFFNFISENNANIFYNSILKIREFKTGLKIIKEPIKEFEKLNFQKKWEKGEIENDQYLLYLNKYSGRTYNDINQYPIFPWVTLNPEFFPENAEKNQIKENDIFYRNMNYLMFTQTENGRNDAIISYKNTELENPNNPIHYRIHYSTGGYILLYLMRIIPFMEEHIRFQKNKFDSPDRMVHNIEEILNIIKNSKDTRELIPEFFTSIEYFLNLNYVFFGQRASDNIIVNNMNVPQTNLYREKLINYIYFNKVLLNNNVELTLNNNIFFEKCKINEWIDIVFGYNQYPKNLKKFNAFEKYSNRLSFSLYKSLSKLKKKEFNDNEIIKRMQAKINRVLFFGQTPEQMFKSKHSKIKEDWKEDSSNKYYDLFDSINDTIKIITFWVSDNKKNIFFLVKNIVNKNMYIFIYDDKMIKKNEINIGKIKLFNVENIIKKDNDEQSSYNKRFKKLETFNNFIVYDKLKSNPIEFKDISELYSLNPRDAIFEIFDENNIYFFIGRNKDNTIKIFSKDNIIKGIIKLNSFVSTLHKKDNNGFFSGHMNGNLIEWIIDYNINSNDSIPLINNVLLKRELKAHNNTLITAINFNEKHNIILTADIKGILYIRKYYDFELLSIVQLKENNCYVNKILVNDYNLIYTINYNKKSLKKFICLYTLNGILLERSNEHSIMDVHSLKSGKIILNRLEELNLFIFGFNKKKPKEEALIPENICKKIELKIKNIDYIMNFWIIDNNIYLLLKNGQFVKGFYNSLSLVCYGVD